MKRFLLYCLLFVPHVYGVERACAVYVLTVAQQGSTVTATGSGTLDLFGLTPGGPNSIFGGPNTYPTNAGFGVGPSTSGAFYLGIAGPTSFGPGPGRVVDSFSGDFTYLAGSSSGIGVPNSYVSGTFLSGSDLFNNATFATIGITPGIYTYTWGRGSHADSFVLRVVPEPSAWVSFGIGAAVLGLVTLHGRWARA